jgi:hypothetical protein
LTGPPGEAEEGLPHLLCLPARSARIASSRGCEQEVFPNHSFPAVQRLVTRVPPPLPRSFCFSEHWSDPPVIFSPASGSGPT